MAETRSTMRVAPTLELEQLAWDSGIAVVCGMDEVGRGAWAGPVTVGAVVPGHSDLPGVRDSKQLSRRQRELMVVEIERWAHAIGVGHATASECDALGMTAAQRLAGERALHALSQQGFSPGRIILDGNHDYLKLGSRVMTVIKGDAISLACAAASIVAKVTRDQWMIAESIHYPGFDFDSNVGYPAPAHRQALAKSGPTAIHRRTWAFMDRLNQPALAFDEP